MTVGIILGMVLLTYYFSGVEQAQRNPNGEPASMIIGDGVEVPLKRNRQGHYVVTGSINGSQVDFLLDTGATDVVIPEDIARRIGLPYGRQGRAMTANGPVVIHDTHIDLLTIGDIQLRDIDASINPAMRAGAILLGMSALGEIEFSQQGTTLTLRQKTF